MFQKDYSLPAEDYRMTDPNDKGGASPQNSAREVVLQRAELVPFDLVHMQTKSIADVQL